jgi:hypothetical protein
MGRRPGVYEIRHGGVTRVVEDVASVLPPDGESGLFARRLPGAFEVADAPVFLRRLDAGCAAGSVEQIRAVGTAALLIAALDDVEGPPGFSSPL